MISTSLISLHLFIYLNLHFFLFIEACIMAAEPEAKFAIHVAAREGKSKSIREEQSKLSH
jgi:hypothetical protein